MLTTGCSPQDESIGLAPTDYSQGRIQMQSAGYMVQGGTGMVVLRHRLKHKHADMGRALALSDVDNTTETWTCSPS